MIRRFDDKKPTEKAHESFNKRMYAIDCELRKKEKANNPQRNIVGARKYILNAYEQFGTNGAILALKTYNKKMRANYTWDDVKRWIAEELQKAGDVRNDID